MATITVAKGDGIGPEIMDATLDIILAAGANLSPSFTTVRATGSEPQIKPADPNPDPRKRGAHYTSEV